MPLIDLWNSSPDAILEFNIEQVVSSAGDGKLRDGSQCSDELRHFLSEVSADNLSGYIDHCLSNSFSKSGMVLQDLVNEVGRRLDYEVSNGVYNGTRTNIGNDGLWQSPDSHSLVIEVKTTDTYSFSLDKLAQYRQQLIDQNQIGNQSSILIVVGREDTGQLEAQIRGSKHAWDMRLISTEALIRLMKLKQETDDTETSALIRGLLVPVEYTRLDGLVDAIFKTAKDVGTKDDDQDDADEETQNVKSDKENPNSVGWEATSSQDIQDLREIIIERFSHIYGHRLLKKTRATYWDSKRSVRAACTISKRYTRKGQTPYWYAYHPKWHTYLKEADKAFFILGCMDLQKAFVIPLDVVEENLTNFNQTSREATGEQYWHIKILELSDGEYALQLPKSSSSLPLKEYELELP